MKAIYIVFSTIILFCIQLFTNYVSATPQEAQFYEKVAEQYILAQFPVGDETQKIIVKANNIDINRDFKGKCEGFLIAQLHGDSIKSTSTVKISCQRPNDPFTLYVPVKVIKKVPAIVATRNINKGEIIDSSDISVLYVENNSNVATAVGTKEYLVGSKVKMNIKQGDMIKASQFCVVCKGDSVSLEAATHALLIKTTATALEDGFINETIKVKNNQSRKVINASVIAPGIVRVNM